jgi:hypothetical protein
MGSKCTELLQKYIQVVLAAGTTLVIFADHDHAFDLPSIGLLCISMACLMTVNSIKGEI